jgi:gas vesicle protein
MSAMYKQEEVNTKVEGGQEHDVIPVADESGGNIRRVKRLLSGRFNAQDRRKRQKLVNEFTKKQNVELKAIVRRQAEELKESKQQIDDELKELKSRNADLEYGLRQADLEYGLRQACADNLSLLKSQMTGSDSHFSSFPKHLQNKHERVLYGKTKQT